MDEFLEIITLRRVRILRGSQPVCGLDSEGQARLPHGAQVAPLSRECSEEAMQANSGR